MIGTSGSSFTVVFNGTNGQVGYRPLGGGQYRVRFVPVNTSTPAPKGFSVSGSKQFAYSSVVYELGLASALCAAKAAAGFETAVKPVTVDPVAVYQAAKAAVADAKAKVDAAYASYQEANTAYQTATSKLSAAKNAL